jgi:hypothetical protein
LRIVMLATGHLVLKSLPSIQSLLHLTQNSIRDEQESRRQPSGAARYGGEGRRRARQY